MEANDKIVVFVGSLSAFKANTVGIQSYCGKCNCLVHLSDTTIKALKDFEHHPVILVCEKHWKETIKEDDLTFVPLSKEQIDEINNHFKNKS